MKHQTPKIYAQSQDGHVICIQRMNESNLESLYLLDLTVPQERAEIGSLQIKFNDEDSQDVMPYLADFIMTPGLNADQRREYTDMLYNSALKHLIRDTTHQYAKMIIKEGDGISLDWAQTNGFQKMPRENNAMLFYCNLGQARATPKRATPFVSGGKKPGGKKSPDLDLVQHMLGVLRSIPSRNDDEAPGFHHS